ncbi:hypothetical protein FRC03_011037 [Tulasnella sp. 419]|nr:hypothetical protein FRC03_011037 [Tulasnella sp. 419]
MDIVTNERLYFLVVGRTLTTRYTTLCAGVWLIYDWMLTLGDEVELIWSTDWSLAGKPLYLFVRYGGMIYQIYDLIQMLGSWSQKLCVEALDCFQG